MSDEPVILKTTNDYTQYLDKGPWETKMFPEGTVYLYSDDFEHDVSLKVMGDFASSEDKLNYANALAEALNNAAAAVLAQSTIRHILQGSDNG